MSKVASHLDAAVFVQEWQRDHHHDDSKPEDRSVTARLCGGILDVYGEALRQLAQPHRAETTPKPVHISLERARGLIALWSDGYGIQDGKLDETLAKSRNIRRSTLKTLSSIATTLLGRLIPLTHISSDKLSVLTLQLTATVDEASYMIHDVIHGDGDDRSDASSDGFSGVGIDDSIAEVAEDLKTDAQCLMDLDPLFRDPVLDLASHKQKQNLETIDWTPKTVFCDKIQQRFPKADTNLVETLGKANWVRFLRCQQTRNLAETGTLRLPDPSNDKGEAGTVAASSKYHDSGLGTSLPTASSYAETVMTYGAGDGKKVRIPPLPEEAKKGSPFPCLACGRSVRITHNSGWKRHLYLDLQPYLCLEGQCSEYRFGTRAAWVAHLALDHRCEPAWDAITCPLCLETTEKGKIAVTTHLARHLEEISLSALPAYPDEDDDEAFETDSDGSSEVSAANAAEETELDLGKAEGKRRDGIRCICHAEEPRPRVVDSPTEVDEPGGLFIQCDKCKCWQHGSCMGFRSDSMVPDTYYCEKCKPEDHSLYQDEDGNQLSQYIGQCPASPADRSPESPTTWEYSYGGSFLLDQAKAAREALAEADRKRRLADATAREEALEREELDSLYGYDDGALETMLEAANRKARLEHAEQEALQEAIEEERRKATRFDDEEEALREILKEKRQKAADLANDERALEDALRKAFEEDKRKATVPDDDEWEEALREAFEKEEQTRAFEDDEEALREILEHEEWLREKTEAEEFQREAERQREAPHEARHHYEKYHKEEIRIEEAWERRRSRSVERWLPGEDIRQQVAAEAYRAIKARPSRASGEVDEDDGVDDDGDDEDNENDEDDEDGDTAVENWDNS